MKPLAARPPSVVAVVVAVTWPSLLLGALFGLGMFDALLLAAIVWRRDADVGALPGIAFKVSAMFGVFPGLLWLVCSTGEAAGVRGFTRRAAWLRRAASIARSTSALVRVACLGAVAVIALLIIVAPSGREAVGALYITVFAAAGAMLVLPVANRRMRIAAVRALRHARRLCPTCHYDVTGLARCPECGGPVRRRHGLPPPTYRPECGSRTS